MVIKTVLIKDLGSTGAWLDISSAVVEDSPSLRDGFGSFGSGLDVGKLSVTIHVQTLAEAALYQTNQKQVRLLLDGLLAFEGFTLDASSIVIENRTDYVFVTLSAYPYSKAFSDSVLASELILKDVKVCDPSDTANSLVHILFAQLYANLNEPYKTILSGVSPVAVAAIKTKTVPLVIISKGKNILNTIDDVLYQNGLVYYMDDYTAIVVEPYQIGRPPTEVLPITTVVASPTLSQKPYIIDTQCKLRFPTIEIVEGEQVFKLNEKETIQDIAAGAYYPEDGRLIADYTTEKAENDNDVKLVLTEEPVLTFDSASLTDYNSALYSNQAFIRLLNATGATLQLKNIWVHARAWYRKYKTFYLDSSLADNITTVTVDGDYIPDKAESEKFLAAFKAELLAEKTSLTIKTKSNLQPNTIIQIDELPYYLLVRSRTRILDGLGLFQYECVAYSVVGVTATTSTYAKTPEAIVEPARGISLYSNLPLISISSRGELKTTQIEITVSVTNLPIASVIWDCPDGTLEQVEISEGIYDPYRRLLDCSTVEGDSTSVTVTAEYGGQTYSFKLGFPKVPEGLPTPMYLNAQASVPSLTEDGPLTVGDFFLYIGTYLGPGSDPGNAGLNPPYALDNEFIYGRIYEYKGKDSEDLDIWSESRKSEHLAAAQKDALQIAKDTNTYLFVAVLVAQLGLFQDLLVYASLKSTNYTEDSEGRPTSGFSLDGIRGLIKVLGLEAYSAMIYGNLESSGFRTLQEESGVTIAVTSISPSLWKHSEMTGLISDSECFEPISGIVEGFPFIQGTKRNNSRILLDSHGWENETISAQEAHIFSKLNPDRIFGNSFFYAIKGSYSGNFSKRTLFRMSSDARISMSTGTNTWILSGGSAEGIRSFGENYYGEGTVNLDNKYTRLAMVHGSYAYWGSKSSRAEYLKMYTTRTFSGLVLRSAEDDILEVGFEPFAYYPDTLTWQIGEVTQADKNTYVSGTDFYNLFAGLQIGSDGYCDGGQINVNGTLYSITRLAKGPNSLTFYTSGGVVTVSKFQEGTSVGVYTQLAITEAINFQAVTGGIETKHIFPWGTQAGTPGTYDIGTLTERFSTAYLQYLDVLNNILIRGALTVNGAANVATINTGGLGDFKVGQNLRPTDSVTFANMRPSGYKNLTLSSNYSMPTMSLGESGVFRFVGNNSSSRYIYLPSGGIYYVIDFYFVSEWLISTSLKSGGSNLTIVNSSVPRNYLIWRVT